MSEPSGLTLVLGGFGAGKTTLLVQMFGRMQSADSRCELLVHLRALRQYGMGSRASHRDVPSATLRVAWRLSKS